MRKILLCLFFSLCLLFSHSLHAQLVTQSSGLVDGFMKEQYIEVGLQGNGAFGSLGPCPSNYFYSTNTDFGGRLGFISDPGKDGWTVGTPPYIGDYFLPGSPFEGFTATLNGTSYLNSGTGGKAIPGALVSFSTDDTSQSVTWEGTINGLKVRQVATVQTGRMFILLRVYLVNTTAATINNVYYARIVDPDNEETEGGGFATDNYVEQQNPNSTSTALVSGRGTKYGSYLGLGTMDCRARVAVGTNTDGSQIWNNSPAASVFSPGHLEADTWISVAFNVGNIAPGDSAAVSYAYVLSQSDLAIAMSQTQPLFSLNGKSYISGSSVNVCTGVVDQLNISNGSDFSWNWSPATGLDKTTGPVVNATLTGPMTYTATGTNVCGTNTAIVLTLNPTISSGPGDATAIAGPTQVLPGANATFTIPAITGANDYQWTLPPGATYVSGSGTNSIVVNFGAGSMSGPLTTYGENACGIGGSASLNFTVINSVAPVLVAGLSNPTGEQEPGVTGPAPAGWTVLLYDGATFVGSAVANADGTYTVAPSANLSVGTHSLTVKMVDASSDTTAASPALSVTILNQPPQPGVPALVSGNNPTSNNEPPLTGSALANSTVTVYADGVSIGTTTAGSDGTWIYTPASPIADGTHSITVTAANGSGVSSIASPALSLTVDATPPVQPGTPALVSGQSPVNNNEPPLKGSAEANSLVTVYVDGTSIGQTTAGSDGTWTLTPASAIADGAHSITVTATDAVGNISIASAALSLTVDTTPPVQPGVPALVSGQSPDKNNMPPLTGSAEANSTVTVYVDGTSIGQTTAGSDGTWTLTPSSAIADGAHSITVTATDAVGNISIASAALSLTVDTTPPVQPGVPALVSGQSPDKNNMPPLTGSAEANSTVTVYVDGTSIGQTTAGSDGTWTLTPASAIADGAHSITVTATDAAGNASVSSASLPLTVDTTPPAQPGTPVLAAEHDGYSTTTTPTLTGTAEAGSTVTVYDGSTVIGTTVADANGNWSYTGSAALSQGNHSISTTATDAAGNVSVSSSKLSFIVDSIAPATPSAPELQGGMNGYISSSTPTMTGTAEAGSTVTIYDGGTAVGAVTADAGGNWTYTFSPALSESAHTISVSAADAAGNTSGKSPDDIITVDITSPSVTVSAPAPQAGGPVTVTITFSEAVYGLDASSIQVTNGNAAAFTAVSPTVYTILVTPLYDQGVTVSVAEGAAKDNAGNSSKASNELTMQGVFNGHIAAIYPVPATSTLNIQFDGVVNDEGRVLLISMGGQYVYDQTTALQGRTLAINVSAIPSGTYVLVVKTKDYAYSTKVVIAH
jgi:hypothetical protein